MSLYLDKQIIANSGNARSQYEQITNMRKLHANREESLIGEAVKAGLMTNSFLAANAGRVPADTYRDFDRTIKRVMAGDEGSAVVSLLPTRSLPVGKIVAEYARASDSGIAQATISGRQAHKLDRAAYDYDGGLVLVHDAAFGRQWREVEAMRSEDFDGLQDDQSNTVRAVRRSINDHVFNGVADVEYKGTMAYGIKNSPNTQALDLGTSGVNVDLSSNTAAYSDFEKAIVSALQSLQGSANNVEEDITFAFSADIWFNALRTGTTDTNFTTILEACRRIPGVANIVKTNGTQLSGNEFLAWANSEQYIQLQVGMAVNTQPVVRNMFNDPYNFVTWGAAGLLVKADAAGRSGVMYASELS